MRVYLSSTLNDLKPERQAVKDALSGLDTVVESYDADEASVRAGCLADVATCELYVGIVGLRYGFVPPGESKSITELEFDAATTKAIRRLLFLKDPAAIAVTMSDSHTQECNPKLIDAFRKQLNSGEEGIPRPAVFSTCEALKEKLLRALLRTNSPHIGGEEQAPVEPAPAGETELERMLSAHLNRRWAALRGAPGFSGAAVFANLPRPLTAQAVFTACVGEKPVPFLTKLRGFVGKREDGGSSISELGSVPDLLEAVLLMTLVASERYVKAKVGTLAVQDSEPIGGVDPRVAAVLAAACYGFGIRLRPSRHGPENFVRPAAEEFGYEQGRMLVRRELLAAANRLTLESPPPLSESDLQDEEVLGAVLDYAREVLGCRLVLVTHGQSRLCEPSVRASVLGALDVPIVFEGVPREAVRDVLFSLRGLIGPLIDGALGPLVNTPEPKADTKKYVG